MAKVRMTIHEESDNEFQKGDKLVDVYPGPDDSSGMRYVVEREVADLPDYWPGRIGTATVTNNYGVSYPLQHGVWVSKSSILYFALFEVKGQMRTLWQEGLVSEFEPDLSAGDLLHQASRDLAEAKTKIRLWKRRFENTDAAHRAVIKDINHIMRSGGHGMGLTTSIGATLKTWLSRREEEDDAS